MQNKNYYKKALLLGGLILGSGISLAQTTEQSKIITKEYNIQQLKELENNFKANYEKRKEKAKTLALVNQWELTIKLPDGSYAELQDVAEDGSPLYYKTSNADASISTRTNYLNTGGGLGLNLDGSNMIAYVWDGGHARVSHQEYDGAGGSNRVTIMDAASEGGTQLDFHAAHVTGTIAASGYQPAAKGMAPKAKVRGYKWNNDIAEATAAAANGMLVSNHSYGFGSEFIPDSYFGSYISQSRDWDQLMHNAPYYLMVVAAGNDGNQNYYNASPLGGNSQYDKLSGTAVSKNNLVVANAQDANINSQGELVSVSINSTSSEGPTDDFRIKPDITGNGTNVYSTYHNSNSAYNSISGTSMASPNVAGSCILLQEHYNNLNGSFMKAATLKGLVLHTADDAGQIGPDAIFGWGLMNTKRAAEAITANGSNSEIKELTLNSGQSYTMTVNANNVDNLIASISWTDLPGTATSSTNSSTARLVNDLDIRVTKNGSTYYPYRLTGVTTNGLGDNTKDPYERISVANASGSYTITVTNKGNLSGGSQNFSLIVTGISANVADTQAPSAPINLSVTSVEQTSAVLTWNASTDNVGVTGYDIFQGTNNLGTVAGTSANITGLSEGSTTQFKVRAKDAAGNISGFSNTITVTTTGAPVNNNCSNTVGLPYSESFESANNAWIVATNNQGKWTRNSGTTPSSGTGPSSAADGSNYMFVEASGNGSGYPSINSVLRSPCIDLGSATAPKLNFKYHANGTGTMGSLKVDISTDNGLTWSTIWSKTAHEGDSWKTANVDLASYNGQTIALRLNRTTGNTWQSDIAVDDITVINDVPVLNYCASNGNSTSDEYIQKVTVGSINNTSVAGTGGYQNFTNLATVISGSNTISITPKWTGTVYNEGYAVWIDYNRDGDFTDAGELVFSKAPSQVSVATGSFTVPSSATSGVTRMRVSMKYNGVPSSCEAFSYGEVEDYTVNVINNSNASYSILADEEATSNNATLENSSIELYPNPVNNGFNLSVSDFKATNYAIYDGTGKLIQSGAYANYIRFENKEKGLYILRVSNKEQTLVKRFLKQ